MLTKPVPTANDLHRIIQLEFVTAIGDPLVEYLVDVQFVDGDH